MKVPILVFDGLDVEAYETVQDAERYLEPTDVRHGVYQVFDSEGWQLHLKILSDASSSAGFPKHLVERPPKEYVVITENHSQPNQTPQLMKRLCDYFRWVGSLHVQDSVSEEKLCGMSLDQLIGMVPRSH